MADRVSEDDMRRAREVLSGAGWVFDLHRKKLMEVMVSTADQAEREVAYQKLRMCADMQADMMHTLETFKFEQERDAKVRRFSDGR